MATESAAVFQSTTATRSARTTPMPPCESKGLKVAPWLLWACCWIILAAVRTGSKFSVVRGRNGSKCRSWAVGSLMVLSARCPTFNALPPAKTTRSYPRSRTLIKRCSWSRRATGPMHKAGSEWKAWIMNSRKLDVNSEDRDLLAERRRKSETQRAAPLSDWPFAGDAGGSGFGIRISFGFRHSGFGFGHDLATIRLPVEA